MSKPEYIEFPEGTYVAMAEMGDCRVCGKREDLRMGACFHCSSNVSGKRIPGGHELWQTDKPTNRWQVKAQ